MNITHPKVSIGLPVFNGENFLADAIESILGQTFTDFELIISDNGSTDATQQICENYAQKDSRIRYYRQEENLGAARNFNFVFEVSNGEYFKWVSHDDLCAPEFIERCVTVLDHDKSAVLCYPLTRIIDKRNQPMLNYVVSMDTASDKPYVRLHNMICTEHWSFQVFGLFRVEQLRKTSLIGSYTDSDMVLLVQTCLLGKVVEIPDYLFFRREHPDTSTNLYKTHAERMAWFDPAHIGNKTFPLWLKFKNYFLAITHYPLGFIDRILCYLVLFKWTLSKIFLRLARKFNYLTDRSHIAVPVEGVDWS